MHMQTSRFDLGMSVLASRTYTCVRRDQSLGLCIAWALVPKFIRHQSNVPSGRYGVCGARDQSSGQLLSRAVDSRSTLSLVLWVIVSSQ